MKISPFISVAILLLALSACTSPTPTTSNQTGTSQNDSAVLQEVYSKYYETGDNTTLAAYLESLSTKVHLERIAISPDDEIMTNDLGTEFSYVSIDIGVFEDRNELIAYYESTLNGTQPPEPNLISGSIFYSESENLEALVLETPLSAYTEVSEGIYQKPNTDTFGRTTSNLVLKDSPYIITATGFQNETELLVELLQSIRDS